ncbi:hypothetical protein CEXT_776911, partial [Caerostris extrusa]
QTISEQLIWSNPYRVIGRNDKHFYDFEKRHRVRAVIGAREVHPGRRSPLEMIDWPRAHLLGDGELTEVLHAALSQAGARHQLCFAIEA